MNSSFDDSCSGCPNRVVCRCLNVTEDQIAEAIEDGDLNTVRDVRKATGAGTGCMCCHSEIKRMLSNRQSLVVV